MNNLNFYIKNINKYINNYKIEKFLFIYEIKLISAYIKYYYLLNLINYEKKKFFLNFLILLKKKIKIFNIKNIIDYIDIQFIKYNSDFYFKFLFFDKYEKNNIIYKFMLLDEIEKINIQIIFIRKSIIFICEKEYKTFFYDFNKKILEFNTLGNFFLSINELLKKSHINLFDCKKKINFSLLKNKLFFIKKKINQKILKKILNFKNKENYILKDDKNYILLFSNFCVELILNLSKIYSDIIYLKNNYDLLNFKNNDKIILDNLKIYFSEILSNNINISLLLNNSLFSEINKNYEKYHFKNIYIIKKVLYYFNKFILIIKFNKKILLNNFIKKKNNFFPILYYLYDKKQSIKESLEILNNCLNYINKKKKNLYNITLKEFKNINNIFEKNIFSYFIKYKFKKISISFKENLEKIQKEKFYLNNIILKFK
ncbi:MAG: hypothetical protein ACH6QQ_00580 [Candidatus Carsonella ruddii]